MCVSVLFQGSKVTLISTFCDASGMFKMGSGSDPPGAGPDVISGASGEEGQRERMTSAEEEEQLLYGDIATLTSAISNDQQGWVWSTFDLTALWGPLLFLYVLAVVSLQLPMVRPSMLPPWKHTGVLYIERTAHWKLVQHTHTPHSSAWSTLCTAVCA